MSDESNEAKLLALVTEDTRKSIKSDAHAINGLMIVAMDNLLISLGVYTKEAMADSYNELIADRIEKIAARNTASLLARGWTSEKYLAARAKAEAAEDTFRDVFGPAFGRGGKDDDASSESDGQATDGRQGDSAEGIE